MSEGSASLIDLFSCPKPEGLQKIWSDLKFFSLFWFDNILTAIVSFFPVTVKFISRQVHTQPLIPTPFDIKIVKKCTVYSILLSEC